MTQFLGTISGALSSTHKRDLEVFHIARFVFRSRHQVLAISASSLAQRSFVGFQVRFVSFVDHSNLGRYFHPSGRGTASMISLSVRIIFSGRGLYPEDLTRVLFFNHYASPLLGWPLE